jgi:hypothetical protein
MEDLFDKDDAIGRLVREEGLLKTSPDFTARVMHIVNESPQKAETAYKPLLSKSVWTSIILGFITLTIISRFVVVSDEVTDIPIFDRLKPALTFINEIHFSIKIASNTLMLTTIIMACVGSLLLLDYFLNKRFSQN